jgi:hypothetical protein
MCMTTLNTETKFKYLNIVNEPAPQFTQLYFCLLTLIRNFKSGFFKYSLFPSLFCDPAKPDNIVNDKQFDTKERNVINGIAQKYAQVMCSSRTDLQ